MTAGFRTHFNDKAIVEALEAVGVDLPDDPDVLDRLIEAVETVAGICQISWQGAVGVVTVQLARHPRSVLR